MVRYVECCIHRVGSPAPSCAGHLLQVLAPVGDVLKILRKGASFGVVKFLNPLEKVSDAVTHTVKKLAKVTESARACSYYSSKQV